MEMVFTALGVLFLAVLIEALSWGVTVGILYLVCMCFSWPFSLLTATGIWLIMELARSVIRAARSSK